MRRLLLTLIVITVSSFWPLATLASSASAQGQKQTHVLCPEPHLNRLVMPALPDSRPTSLPYQRLNPNDTRLPLGLGHLRPKPNFHVWGWFQNLRLPLFQNPTSAPFAWLLEGWLIDYSGRRRPFGTGGMVETAYESPSFIVYEIRPDGWLRLRYTQGAGANGTAWTHQCLFKLSPVPIDIERWEARFLSDDISPLYFRTHVRHALRAAPTTASPRLQWIPAAPDRYHLEPIDIRGDWMRVRLMVPSNYCVGPETPAPQTREGWIKWRDDEIGPWLWYYTRGC